jgi:hypothetical protein
VTGHASTSHAASGFVYFIQAIDGGPIKIGYSATAEGVQARLKSMQTGNPQPLVVRRLVEAPPEYERQLHNRLAEWRARGEWFWPSQRVLDVCDLKGIAKVGNRGVSMYALQQAQARARLEGANTAATALSEVAHQFQRALDDGTSVDADLLVDALGRRLVFDPIRDGHFLDKPSVPFESGTGVE